MAKIRHITGRYIDQVQQCTRCLKILIDNRDCDMAGGHPGEPMSPPKYGEGDILIEDGWCTSLGDRPDAEDCKPMIGGME